MKQLYNKEEKFKNKLTELQKLEEEVPRPSSAHQEEAGDAVEAWLRGLDDGRGEMLRYAEPIKQEFESLDTHCAAVLPEGSANSVLGRVDAAVWPVIGATKMGHKLLLAKGLVKLVAEGQQ